MLLRKNESFLEKNIFTEEFFFQASQNPVRKWEVWNTKVVIQITAIKCFLQVHIKV